VRLSNFEEWLTPAEAGRVIGVTKQTMVKWLEDRTIRGVRTHQGWLVDPEDAERVKQARSKG
jgi:excisionase family DNA binding protein